MRRRVRRKELKDTERAKKKKKKKKKKTKKKKGGQGVDGEAGVEAAAATIESQVSEEVATKVYVGGVPYYSTEDDIRSYFESCGTITEIDCMTFPDSGKFRGIAIISFKTDAAAKRALALDGSDMGGFYLKIKPYKTTRSNNVNNFAPQVVEGYNRIYVGNLSWDITEDDLKKFFSGCKISAMRFGMDKETGEFRGYAHVDFSDSLSVMMALKLDQQIVCGRPVKISSAVPKKGVGAASIVVPTNNEAKNVAPTGTEANNGVNASSGNACYECGEKGHLSADCPNGVKAAPIVVPSSTEANNVMPTRAEVNSVVPTNSEADNNGARASSGKTKRRTCYECGEKGHLSADCPKGVKAASIVVSSSTEANNVMPTSTEVNSVVPTNTEADNNGATTSSGKTKGRTCYECGEKGHLSADCPKGAKAESIVVQTGTEVNNVVPISTEANNNGVGASSGKKKRRTCYECGEKGHISTDCPKKQTNDVTDSRSC